MIGRGEGMDEDLQDGEGNRIGREKKSDMSLHGVRISKALPNTDMPAACRLFTSLFYLIQTYRPLEDSLLLLYNCKRENRNNRVDRGLDTRHKQLIPAPCRLLTSLISS